MAPVGSVEKVRLRRDGLTRAVYAWICGWAFYSYGFGAILVFLIDGQQISRSIAGLHMISQAAGTLAAGLASVHVVRRVARRGAIALAGLLVALGLALLAVGAPTVLTVTATFVIGAGGSLGLVSLNPLLVEHHGAVGPAALSEVNALAAAGAVLSPLLIGASVAASWGWRPPLAVAAAGILGGAWWLARRVGPEPALDVRVRPRARGRSPLPPRAPMLLGVTVVVIAAEFSLTTWSVDLIRQRLEIVEAAATTMASALLVGMAVSRLLASRLALRRSGLKLLSGFLVVAVLGWVVLWAAGTAPMLVTGLFVIGLGVGASFPLALALLLTVAGSDADRASARLSVWLALSFGVAPFAMGAMADLTSLHTSFVLIVVLLAVALVGVLRVSATGASGAVRPAGTSS